MLSTALLCFKVESKGVKSNYFQADLIYTNLSAEYDC